MPKLEKLQSDYDAVVKRNKELEDENSGLKALLEGNSLKENAAKKVDVKEFKEVVSAKEKVDSEKEVKETKKAEKDETADKKL